MIRHVVMFKWAPTFTPEIKQRWISGLDRLEGNIPGLLKLSHGTDVLGAGRSWDHAIVADFESLAAVAVYDTHPLHEAIKPLSLPNVEVIAAVDFEL
ncbi:Dabb family protein [Granulicoccus sp. GXG6511]|uniref:Dabb family protein n=1 Tax=Granulicoccus sp. GXG6511 TaxID=3381351 RepID=UPI003D7EBEFA